MGFERTPSKKTSRSARASRTSTRSSAMRSSCCSHATMVDTIDADDLRCAPTFLLHPCGGSAASRRVTSRARPTTEARTESVSTGFVAAPLAQLSRLDP